MYNRLLLLLILVYYVERLYSFNEICEIPGDPVAAPLDKPDLKNFHKHKNYFKLPHDSHMYLGVPSKTGNMHWSALFYKLMYGHAPKSNDDLMEDKPFFQDCRHSKKKTFKNKDDIWLIVRNPYIRFLSTYLEKIEHVPMGDKDYGTWLEKMRSKHSSFKDTIEETLRIILEGLPDNLAWTISPYERARRACNINHHFCMQSAYLHVLQVYPPVKPIRILHAEYQPFWYSSLLECFGIHIRQVTGDEWIPYNGKPCFYSPTPDCDLSTYSIMSTTSNETAILSAMAQAEKDSHSTGSVLKLYKYFDKALASNVSYILEYDLKMLGYPVWDGVSNLPLPQLN